MSFSTFRLTTLLAAAWAGAALAPSSLAAQELRAQSHEVTTLAPPTVATPAPAGTATLRGPRSAPAGIDTRAVADSTAPALPQQGGRHLGAGSNLALMGAGAAAIIVGLMIGGDGGTIVAISGGVLGLVGLFRYIR